MEASIMNKHGIVVTIIIVAFLLIYFSKTPPTNDSKALASYIVEKKILNLHHPTINSK